MREFREQVAQFMTWQTALEVQQMHRRNSPTADDREENTRQTEIQDSMRRSFNAINLLMAERGGEEHAELRQNLWQIVHAPNGQVEEARAQAFATVAADILRRERSAIVKDPGVWREIGISLGCTRRDPPDFP